MRATFELAAFAFFIASCAMQAPVESASPATRPFCNCTQTNGNSPEQTAFLPRPLHHEFACTDSSYRVDLESTFSVCTEASPCDTSSDYDFSYPGKFSPLLHQYINAHFAHALLLLFGFPFASMLKAMLKAAHRMDGRIPRRSIQRLVALMLHRAPSFDIFVRADATLILQVHPEMTIDDLKRNVCNKAGLKASWVWLLCASKPMEDRMVLLDYNVGKHATLHLCLRMRGGGCAGSKPASPLQGDQGNPPPAQAQSAAETAPDQGNPSPAQAQSATATAPEFEISTPMLVMPFLVFKEQGRIFKSIKEWREKALADGRLVEHAKVEGGGTGTVKPDGTLDGTLVVAKGKVAIFVSHTWWDRAYVDETNDRENPYDKGAPDYQSGDKKDKKWRIICKGVEALIQNKELRAEDVVLWVDWQSIYQDVEKEKLKGVMSLIKYATLCDYMLVPTEEAELNGIVADYPEEARRDAARYPEDIPGYGARGWCRCEYFIFSLWAEMFGREVQLYAIKADGAVHQYPQVKIEGAEYMPSGGDLSNPNDKKSVQGLEDKMIEAYGSTLAVNECKKGKSVDLSNKMIRAVHVDALAKALDQYKVTSLELQTNQLGVEGGKRMAEMLKTNTTLTTVKYAHIPVECDRLSRIKFMICQRPHLPQTQSVSSR